MQACKWLPIQFCLIPRLPIIFLFPTFFQHTFIRFLLQQKDRKQMTKCDQKEPSPSPTVIQNVCPPYFDVWKAIALLCPFVCNLPLDCHTVEGFPWCVLRAGHRPGPWRWNRKQITWLAWCHRPYSLMGKSKTLQFEELQLKNPSTFPSFQLCDLQQVIWFSLNFLFPFLRNSNSSLLSSGLADSKEFTWVSAAW